MQVWRIGTDTPDYTADDLMGTGAKKTGGRWNRPGMAVVYCAATPSLACLETVVHLGAGGLPLNRYLVSVEIPVALWRSAETYSATSLPVGWDALPAGMVSLDFGDEWLKSKRTAVLMLPSVIAPEDRVILLNPDHPGAVKIKATKIRKWHYDPRLG